MSKVPEFVTNPNPSLYHHGSYCVLDFETTNEEYGTALNANNKLVLACWAVGQRGSLRSKHYQFGSEFEMQPLLAALQECDFIVAQNAKFELQWLDRCGWDIGSKPVYDTFLAEWVITGNMGLGSLDLDSLCEKYGHRTKSRFIKLMMEGGISTTDMPRSILLDYCMGDVLNTHATMQSQLRAMEGTRLLPIVYTRCLTTLALADIEKNGICLDPQRVEAEYEKVLREYVDVTRQLDAMSGGVNMNSGKQKAEYIYDVLKFDELVDYRTKEPLRTKTNQRLTDSDTILRLAPKTERQRNFIDLKLQQGKLGAALSKTLDFCVGVCRERGGVFYGELRLGTTRTHRLSSAGRAIKLAQFKEPKSCQFQNYPNQYKPLITARNPGWLIGEGDGSQLEFRVGGHLGNDRQIEHDILNKEDIHGFTRDELVRAGEPELLAAPEEHRRRLSKKHTFRPMYGGTQGTPAVEEYCKAFARKYWELHDAQKTWSLIAAEQGWIETEWGMRYWFPKVKITKHGYIQGQQQVFNYPIQALATAEIIPIGLVHFWYRTRDAELFITNTVHDSIICEVPPHEIELFQVAMVQSLTEDVYNYLRKAYDMEFRIPLGVGIKIGTHWSQTDFSDEELDQLVEPIRALGYEPVIDDGEVSVDVPNANYNRKIHEQSNRAIG